MAAIGLKAGDLVYGSTSFAGMTREYATEFVCDAIYAAIGPYRTTRLTNGDCIDTLLRFLDMAVTSKKQLAALREFLEESDEV